MCRRLWLCRSLGDPRKSGPEYAALARSESRQTIATRCYRATIDLSKGHLGALRAAFTKNATEPRLYGEVCIHNLDLIDPDFKPADGDSDGGFVVVGDKPSVVKPIGARNYTSVVSSQIKLVADLMITFLRPEAPGRLRDEYGDLDNRIKTLLDGLKMPNDKNALPKGASLEDDPDPLYCLLEDDSLITRLDIKSDRLLDPDVPPDWVVLLIHVRTRPTVGTFYNLGLA